NKLAVDFLAHRPDNLNAFIYSLFNNNEGGAVYLQNTISTLFAGSHFTGNGGDAVVNMSNSQYTTIVGSDFTDGTKENVFFSNGINVESSRFYHCKNGRAKIFKDGSAHAAMFNSLSNVSLGEVLMNPLIFAGTHISQISWTNDGD
ncbi:MAG: hypothetical protein ACLPSW_20520, partial [Roseiarcus sp.]